MALTKDRNTLYRDGVDFLFPVAATARIYAGVIVALNADGYAVPSTASTGLAAVGIAQARADNATGADGALRVPVRRGCFALDNSAGTGALTLADVGKACYIADDGSVTKTATGKSVAGTVRDVDADGVWVAF